MVARRTDRVATYADIEALPRHVVGEIIGGVLHASPRPAVRHARTASVIGGKLGAPFDWGDGPGGWILLDEPEIHLGSDVVVPDLAGWRRERLPELPDTAFLVVPPDWICEVLSPSTAKVDRTEKLPIHARERVAHVWFVDPIARTLEVLRLDDTTHRIVGLWHDDASVRAEPFDAIELELRAWWTSVETSSATR
ncbi:MAG: Uma2 family endonuclease [Myxococcales bacterium]|nr:Uma2 family endonuclease [Myxococcales bacterium]